jgi:type VI protein secretion system component VasK
LIRDLRRDEYPINGVLVAVPFSMMDARSTLVADYVRDDLHQLQTEFGIDFPVTFVLSEMQQVAGFSHVADGISEQMRSSSRLGHGFDIQTIPTRARLQELADAVVETLEQLVYKTYHRFSVERESASRQLFELLAVTHSGLRQRLSAFLQQSLMPTDEQPEGDNLSLTGCYLAATGSRHSEELMFTNGVIKKVIDSRDNVAWNQSTLMRQYQTSKIAGVILIVSISLLIGGLIMFFIAAGRILAGS